MYMYVLKLRIVYNVREGNERAMPPKLLKRMTTRRVAPRAAVADKDADLVCVAVIPAVELALRASWPGGKAAAGAFEILGPESVLQYIGGSSSKTGVLSPTSIVMGT